MGETPNIHQRIQAIMRDVEYVQKDGRLQMDRGSYTYTSHDAVIAKIRPALVAHGVVLEVDVISYKTDGNRTEVLLSVSFVNVDDPADRVGVTGLGFGIDKQDKGPGKAVSYAMKYVLLKTFALETGDDPERDNIDHVTAQDTGAPAQETVPANLLAHTPARSALYAKITDLRSKHGLTEAAFQEWREESFGGKRAADMSLDELRAFIQAMKDHFAPNKLSKPLNNKGLLEQLEAAWQARGSTDTVLFDELIAELAPEDWGGAIERLPNSVLVEAINRLQPQSSLTAPTDD